MTRLLEVKSLTTKFYTEEGVIHAVNGIDFAIEREKTLCVVGESGCGKSVAALSIIGLVQKPGRIDSGKILFSRNGKILDLAKLDPNGSEMRSIRGNEIAMIFQEPMTSLNPVYTIGNQLMEPIMLHQRLGRRDSRDKAIEMLKSVEISSPEKRVHEYPHQLSGGMRQRVMIAMALSCNPSLLIADEPTTALDVTIQAQVLKLMNDLRTEFGAAIMFITHDLSVVAQMADNVIVMYLGKTVESATVRDIFYDPVHPYTRGLMNSIPSLVDTREKRLIPIEGVVPDAIEVGNGCGFESRCPHVWDVCREKVPLLTEVSSGHYAACWMVSGEA